MINTGVVTQAATAAEAIAQNAERAKRLVAALKSSGIEDRDIQSAGAFPQSTISPRREFASDHHRLSGIEHADGEVPMSAGPSSIHWWCGGQPDRWPQLLAQPDAALDEARTDALAKARVRAELYARAVGLRVERILSISEAGPVPGPIPLIAGRANYMADAEAARTGGYRASRMLTTVTVRFLLK